MGKTAGLVKGLLCRKSQEARLPLPFEKVVHCGEIPLNAGATTLWSWFFRARNGKTYPF